MSLVGAGLGELHRLHVVGAVIEGATEGVKSGAVGRGLWTWKIGLGYVAVRLEIAGRL